MAEAGLAVRTFTRCAITRYSISGGVEVRSSISTAVPPEQVTIAPGVSLNKLKAKALKGASQTVFTFDEGREANISMQFAAATADMMQLITGRQFQSDSNFDSFAYHEVTASATTEPAQTDTTTILYAVAQQTAAGALANGTEVYRIDPTTGQPIQVTVIDFAGSPANANQVAIGDNFALKFHADAATNGYTYYFKVAVTYASVVRMNSTVVSSIGITLWGITLDGQSTVIINAPRCSPNLSGSIDAAPNRQIDAEILVNSEVSSDLGYDIIVVPLGIG